METAPISSLSQPVSGDLRLLGVIMSVSSCDPSTELSAPGLCATRPEQENCALPVCSATVGRSLQSEALCNSVQRSRSSDEEEKRDSLFLVGCDAEYVSDGHRDPSYKILEENTIMAELERPIKQLKRLNKDLQNSLDVSEDCNSTIIAENTALKNQIKTLKQLIEDDRHLVDELQSVQVAKLKQEQMCSTLEASKKQLEKKIEALKDQKEAAASELSNVLADKERYKKKSDELSQVVIALQQELMDSVFYRGHAEELVQEKVKLIIQLEETVSNYRTIKQDMKEKILYLEDQLDMALVKESGCTFMHSDNTESAETQVPGSLREELGLLHVGQMESTSGKEEEEDKAEEEYETIEEEAFSLHYPRWPMDTYEHMKTRVLTTGFFGIGLLVSVALALALTLYDGLGLSCADFLCIMARPIRPYLSIRHTGLPPL